MSDATAEKMTSAYIKIRDERSALAAKFKAEGSKRERQPDVLKRALRGYREKHGRRSVRSTEGCVDRCTRKKTRRSE